MIIKALVIMIGGLLSSSSLVWAVEEDTHGAVSPEQERGLTLYGRVILPCTKGDEVGPKCGFYAIYDQRDDLIYLTKVIQNEQNAEYGAEGFDRDESKSSAFKTIDVTSLYPDKSNAPITSMAHFEYLDGNLSLNVKLIFAEDEKAIVEKVENIY